MNVAAATFLFVGTIMGIAAKRWPIFICGFALVNIGLVMMMRVPR